MKEKWAGVLETLKSAARGLKRELAVYKLVLRDRRTPLVSKLLLGAAIAYILMPFDLIPDFLPVIGQLDDAIIIPALLIGALRFIPKEVVQDCRDQVGGANS